MGKAKLSSFAIVCVVFVLSLLLVPAISFAEDMKQPITIIIAPFENATGDPSLDWVAENLWYEINYDLNCIKTADPQLIGYSQKIPDFKTLLNRISAGQIWKGKIAGNSEKLNYELSAIDPLTGQILYKAEFIGTLQEMQQVSSKSVVTIIREIKVGIESEEEKRVMSVKTNSMEAWKLKAEGYNFARQYAAVTADIPDAYKKKNEIAEKWGQALNKAITIDPSYAEGQLNIGVMYKTTGDWERAISAWHKAKETKPYMAFVDQQLCDTYYTNINPKLSIEFCREAIRKRPFDEYPKGLLVRALASLNMNSEATPLALKLTKSKNAGARVGASYALGIIGDKTALPEMLALAKDNNPTIRQNAIIFIGKFDNELAGQYLMDALKDSDSRVRLAAINGVSKLKYQEAVPLLFELYDKDPEGRRAVLFALKNIGGEKIRTGMIRTVKDKRLESDFCSILGKSFSEDLNILLNDTDKQIRKSAIDCLFNAGDSKALIHTMQNDPDEELRSLAANYAGGLIDTDQVLATLKKGLLDSSGNVRRNASVSLFNLGDKASYPGVMELWDSAISEMDVGHILEGAAIMQIYSSADHAFQWLLSKKQIAKLGAITERDEYYRLIIFLTRLSSVDKLLVILHGDFNIDLRLAAGVALAKSGNDSGKKLFQENAVGDRADFERQSDHMGRFLISSLGMYVLGDDSYLLKLIKMVDEKESLCDANLVKMPDQLTELGIDLKPMIGKFAEVCIDQLTNADAKRRRQSIEALMGIGYREAVPSVRALTKDPDASVRYVAAQFLSKNGELVTMPSPSELAESLNGENRLIAAVDFGNIGGADSISALKTMLSDRDYKVQRTAALSLIKLNDDSGEAVLIKAIRDYDEQVMDSVLKTGQTALFYKALSLSNAYDSAVFHYMRKKYIFHDDANLLIQSSDSFLKSAGYYLLALKAREDGLFEKQLEHARAALKTVNRQERTPFSISSLLLLTEALISLEQSEAAYSSITDAESLLGSVSMDEKRSYGELFKEQVLYLKGKILVTLGKLQDAQAIFAEMAEKLSVAKHFKKSDVHVLKFGKAGLIALPYIEKLEAMIRTDLGALQITAGKENLEKAVEIGRSYQADNRREMESEKKRYAELAKQRVADGNYEEAQKLLEEMNLRQSQFVNKRIKLNLSDPEKKKEIDEVSRRKNEVETLSRQIEEKIGKQNPGKKDNVSSLESERDQKKRELQVYLTNLKKTHPDIAMLLGARPVDLAAIQEQLTDETAILQYLSLTDKIVVFVIKQSGIEIVEIPAKQSELKDKVAAYRKEINSIISGKDSSKIPQLASELHSTLIKPIEDSGKLNKIKVIGIAPNSFLHYLPFGTLMAKDNKYLIDKYDLFYINSTSILWVAMDRAKHKAREEAQFIAFSNPDGSLKYADIEVDGISKLFARNTVYSQGKAKKTALKDMNQDSSMMHFSTHAVFNPIDSTKSYLQMTDSNLTVEDIWGLPLKGTKLTTLSACETGLGEILSGDDIVSLENAFIFAGSPSVISTLWQVEDKSTAELMNLFYENLLKGKTKAQALSIAQRQMKDKYKHPFFWAAFTLRGDWR